MSAWLLICCMLANCIARRYFMPAREANEIAAAHWVAGGVAILFAVLMMKVAG